MVDKPVQLTWQERVKQVELYHYSRIKENIKHRLEDTARELNRSKGRVSEDLQLATYMKTHPRVETFSTVTDALDYIKTCKRRMRLGDV